MKTIFTLLVALSLTTISTAQNVPIDFEADGNGSNWTWSVFENDSNPALEIIDNPDPSGINTSAKVAQFTALAAGQPFAGCESMHGADIGTWTIDEDNSTISIMVWKPTISDVGIKLVREDGWSLGEIKIANTKTNEWERLDFDFSSHMGNTYDQIVIFPDFTDRQADHTIYFDNIYEGVGTTSTKEAALAEVSIYPNPAYDYITITSSQEITSYVIYDIAGQQITTGSQIKGDRIDVSDLRKGVYLLEARSGNEVVFERFIKQ